MIYWLSISSDQYPVLKTGTPVQGMLSPDEQAVFDGLKTPRRRQEWLLGRFAAKLLVQAIIYQRTNNCRPLDELTIGTRPDHSPYLAGDAVDRIGLSLSHSGPRAVCAAVDRASRRIGIDIEQIMSRQQGFAQEYFTEREINLMQASTGALTDNYLLTGIWSAKEAVLKALRVGLAADTKAITCLIDPADRTKEAWHTLEIEINDKSLFQQTTPLRGWQRCENDYVITLVVQEYSQEN